MSVPRMISHLLLERIARRPLRRIPEANAVMDSPAQINAFMEGGSNEGILKHLYTFHAVVSLPVIRPGDRVLDLACGPANQLNVIAQLHPHTQFIGIDASPTMLELARDTLRDTRNVTLQRGDITQLQSVATGSIDCVLSTMSLHHLPTLDALALTMREVRRVLKPGGGLYLADFGRLKRLTTQIYFAHDRADQQSPQFTEDFLQSMRAAFSVDELREAMSVLDMPLSLYTTALAPFLLIFRSAARGAVDDTVAERAVASYRNLNRVQQRDFDNLARWFGVGGLSLPCAVNAAGDESGRRRAGRRITAQAMQPTRVRWFARWRTRARGKRETLRQK